MANHARWRDLHVGIIAAIAVAAVALAVLFFARVGALRGDTFTLFLRANAAPGLMKGSEVWVGGQRVGRVGEIRFLRPTGLSADGLLVVMEVLERHRHAIRRDSRARIEPGGSLIGPPVVSIGPGTPGSPAVGERDTIRARTQRSLESMTSRFGEATRELPAVVADVKRVNQQLRNPRGTIGAFGSERGAVELKAVAQSGGRLAASLGRGRGTIGRLLNARGELMGRAERALARADSVQELFDSPDVAVGRFRRDTTLKTAVADIQNELSIVRAMLNEPRGTAGRIMNDHAIVEALTEAEREMGAIMEDIKRRPFRYLNF
jgi:phospholipid/cholesterol/gamma-HCH transport system substrate-binding protein